MTTPSHLNLKKHMHAGRVYRRNTLQAFSKSVDRDLGALVKSGTLKKLSNGLYFKPRQSAYGSLPPEDENLVTCFLKDDNFLLYSWTQYNSLGLGLTQLYKRVVVLNRKRHGVFKLGNREFDFRRPNNGFPAKLSREFLLVDLLNNLGELEEDTTHIKEKIRECVCKFDKTKLIKLAREYGKVSTKRFFEEIIT